MLHSKRLYGSMDVSTKIEPQNCNRDVGDNLQLATSQIDILERTSYCVFPKVK